MKNRSRLAPHWSVDSRFFEPKSSPEALFGVLGWLLGSFRVSLNHDPLEVKPGRNESLQPLMISHFWAFIPRIAFGGSDAPQEQVECLF